jgi:hypothetical protein
MENVVEKNQRFKERFGYETYYDAKWKLDIWVCSLLQRR